MARLEAVPGWTWTTFGDKWEEGFNHLYRHVEQEGDARLPGNYLAPDGFPLGNWVAKQRSNYRTGKMASDRAQRLDTIPGWNAEAVLESNWEEGFRYLCRYVEREGHARVPKTILEDGYQLGPWVSNQREFHQLGRLTLDREPRLEALPGWAWNTRNEAWEEGYRHLRRYVESEGDARVPSGTVVDGYRLGSWVVKQRDRRGTLGIDRESRLEGLPGWTWNTRSDGWEEGFNNLHRYAEREGHSHVPKIYVENGYQLGSWVSSQRRAYAKGRLAADSIARLDSHPGWTWHTRADLWEEGFLHLCRFAEREVHTRVPALHVEDGYRLGQWVNGQRTHYKNGRLDRVRVDRVEALPGWTWDVPAAKWEEGFSHLCRFAEREGHTHVPANHSEDGYKLGTWVNGQRTAYGNGRLGSDRVVRLEALPGWTEPNAKPH
jgi:hypothetical protein